MPITEFPAGGLGSAVTPEQWAAYVLEHLSAQSVVLASGATRITTALRAIHVPRITADGSADWFAELEEIDVGDPTGDELLLTPKKCAALTRLSNEVVDDSDPSVIDSVGTAMTRAVALKADRAILGGAGGKEPLGVYGQAGQHVVGAVTIDSLIDAAGLVERRRRAGAGRLRQPGRLHGATERERPARPAAADARFLGRPKLDRLRARAVVDEGRRGRDGARVRPESDHRRRPPRPDGRGLDRRVVHARRRGVSCDLPNRLRCERPERARVDRGDDRTREQVERRQVEQIELTRDHEVNVIENQNDPPVDLDDWEAVPDELLRLLGRDGGQPIVISEDGVSRDVLVVVPSMFAAARRAREN